MNAQEQKAYDEALRRIEECRRKGPDGTFLDLGRMGLTALPPEISQLASLKVLSLSGNLDAAAFEAILTRHALTDRWAQFQRQFLSDTP